MNGLSQVMPAQDLLPALTSIGGLLFNLAGILIDVTFGFIGGLIGAVFDVRRAVA